MNKKDTLYFIPIFCFTLFEGLEDCPYSLKSQFTSVYYGFQFFTSNLKKIFFRVKHFVNKFFMEEEVTWSSQNLTEKKRL